MREEIETLHRKFEALKRFAAQKKVRLPLEFEQQVYMWRHSTSLPVTSSTDFTWLRLFFLMTSWKSAAWRNSFEMQFKCEQAAKKQNNSCTQYILFFYQYFFWNLLCIFANVIFFLTINYNSLLYNEASKPVSHSLSL